MTKYYLTFVMSDTPNAVDILSRIDHKSTNPCEYVIGKPKMSLLQLLWIFYNLKKLLETCYEKLEADKRWEEAEEDIEIETKK